MEVSVLSSYFQKKISKRIDNWFLKFHDVVAESKNP